MEYVVRALSFRREAYGSGLFVRCAECDLAGLIVYRICTEVEFSEAEQYFVLLFSSHGSVLSFSSDSNK